MWLGRTFRLVFWTGIWLQGAGTPISDKCDEKELLTTAAPVVRSGPSQELLVQFTQVQEHKQRDAMLPFIGLTNSADQSRSCCKNGGTCILGSFCACPRFFTGRSCEYDTRIRNCDVIPHGEWVQKGCSYCRCGYGMLHCFPHVFHADCDDSEEVRFFRSSAARLPPDAALVFWIPVFLVLAT